MTNRAHRAVGIDLGTTFSAVAALDESGRPETIRNAEGDLTTPSVVFFDRKKAIIGVEAIEAGLHEPERLAQFAKRDIGEVAYQKQICGETFPPEVVQALVLQKLKSDAELSLGPIEQAVVTVPAFFNEPCRKATQDAGALAGLRVLDVINEPTAAAITYGMRNGFLTEKAESRKRETVLVYDLGGGTFDVTLMKIKGGSYTTIATAGDVYLGGIDWDLRIADLIADAFLQTHQIDPRLDPVGLQELMRKANQVKHALTQRESSLVAFGHEGNRLRMELSQQEFAEATSDLVERTLLTTRLVMDEAGLGFDDLTQLILVGGSSRMPMIRSELQQLTGLQANLSLSPDEAVCHGAALYAGILLKHEGEHLANVSVRNVNSHDLGVLAVNPITGDPQRAIMIGRNSRLPASREIRFRTFRNDQPNVKIHVVEGGDDAGKGATTLGKCFVNPLPPGTPKGTKVDVKFHYSQNGRLTVSASLPSLDRSVETEIQRESGLEHDQVQTWKERIARGLGMPDHGSDENSKPEASPQARTTRDRTSIDTSPVEHAALSAPDLATRSMDHASKDAPSRHTASSDPGGDDTIGDDTIGDDTGGDDTGGDDPALAAFLNSPESGCLSRSSDDSVVATTPLDIETSEPCKQSASSRKKLKRVSRTRGVEQPSDWKSRRQRF